MINWKIYILFTFIFLCFDSKAAGESKDIEKFKKIEKRVRYKYPDSLKFYAHSKKGIFKDPVFVLWAKGKYDYLISKFDSAYIHISKAKSIALQNNLDLLAAEISLDLNNCLAISDNTGKALEEILFARKIFEAKGNNEQIARTLIAQAELYRKIGKYEKAQKTLIGAKSKCASNPTLMASFYNRRAAIKTEMGDLDSSYYFSKLALKEAGKSDDRSLIGISENEIGYVLKHWHQNDSALLHFIRADTIFQQCGMIAYSLQTRAHIAVLYSISEKHRKAVNLLLHGYQIALKNNWFRIKRDYSEFIRNAYYGLKILDSANYYNIEYYKAHLALLESQHSMNSVIVETLFEEEKLKEQISRSEKLLQQEINQRKIAESEQAFMKWILILGILVLIFSLYFLFIQIKRRKIILADKLEKEKKNQQLELLLKNNEALVQEMSHRVKNNLSVLSGLLGIQKSRALNPELKKELGETMLRVDSIAAIHNQFYDSRESSQINLRLAFEDLIRNITLSMGYNPGEIVQMKIDEISVDIAHAVNISMILNELLTNSFKYAIKNSSQQIEVELTSENGFIKLTVTDPGDGFDPDKIKPKTSGTDSMGLYLIDLLCRQIQAQKEVKKEKEKFCFTITFKKS